MKTLHSPGPWHMKRLLPDLINICGPDGNPVNGIGGFSHAPDDHVAIANGVLAAAAPTMLQALLITPLDLHPPDSQGECLCSQCSFRKAARIAIEKATTIPH